MWGEVLAAGFWEAAMRRSMMACAISSMSSICAWNWRPQSPDLLSVAAIWWAVLCPGRSGEVPRSNDDNREATYRQPSATT